MKKLIPVLLAVVMIVSLAACGQKATTEQKVLKVAMEAAYAPYNWTQSDDSNGAVPIFDSKDYAYGYDVMMAKLICEKLGWKLEVHKMDWDSIPVAVQSGTVDAGICGQSITAKRLQTMDFSEPYYYASIVSLTRTDSPLASATGLSGLAGATTTSQINTVWYDTCLPQIKDANILPAMDTTSAMLIALESKKVDLIVTDEPTAMAAASVYPDMKVLDFTGKDDNFKVSDEEINIGISVKKGNKDLADQLNSVLSTLTADDYKQMMADAIKVQPLSK
ncbi:putative lysine transport system substrate-binding protein [Sporobacter termitidis DSM 10068]|uniref:Putative lysine transport system substrate-binding protein n=1 Tax=Sporobacter termitidis DSM 10068 TaxID=1123282 RepID=A0A1M5Z6S1_9FIRM|nr:putative lysine transport system substrate-binding protein [Sporobacter termitidis DSM 10068]